METVTVKIADLTGPALDWARLQPESDQPKTFGCHHNAPTCRNCDWLVRQWLKRELGHEVSVPANLLATAD